MDKTKPMRIPRRPRRLRRSQAIRRLVRETHFSVDNLIQPLFVIDGDEPPEPVSSMPGISRFNINDLVEKCRHLEGLGIPAVILFPKLDPSLKNDRADEALRSETLIIRAVQAVKRQCPELVVMTDIALDPYTSHGHDGVLTPDHRDVDNDKTIGILQAMAVMHARAGVDFVAPSDMMDGRIEAIRDALDELELQDVGILSYSAKFSSAYYGPFRDAVGSAASAGTHLLGKQTYQLDPANRREALLEALLDENEFADVIMVKPAGPYLDIIREIRDRTTLPVAAYQVSGEYAQIHAAAEKGWLDLKACRDETLLAIRRAGADWILTYFAESIAEELRGGGD